MSDGMNVQCVVNFFCEAHAIVADTKAQLVHLALEFFNIAFAGLSESLEREENTHSSIAIEAADIGAGPLGPGDFLHA